MAAAYKNSEVGNYADTANPVHTYGISIAANDIIVAAICIRANFSLTMDGSFTEISSYGGGSAGIFSYKRAGASETSFSVTTSATGDCAVGVVLLSGVDVTTALDGTPNEDETNINGSVTSQGTNSTTPATSSGTLVSCMMGERGSFISAGSWSNATERCAPINDTVGAVSLGTWDYADTSARSDTYSHSGTSSNMYGAIAAFRSAAGGGGTTIDLESASMTMTDQAIALDASLVLGAALASWVSQSALLATAASLNAASLTITAQNLQARADLALAAASAAWQAEDISIAGALTLALEAAAFTIAAQSVNVTGLVVSTVVNSITRFRRWGGFSRR